MGYAIRRSDGTYRGWVRHRSPQDEASLRHGETWEEIEFPPEITPDPETPEQKDARLLRNFNGQPALKAVVTWVAQQLGVNEQLALQQIINIYRNLV